MRLTELNPRFIGHGGEGITKDGAPVPYSKKAGIASNCPCGCADELFVVFKKALDTGLPIQDNGWDASGSTFDDLTLTPSIQRVGGCSWHGFITNGEVR